MKTLSNHYAFSSKIRLICVICVRPPHRFIRIICVLFPSLFRLHTKIAKYLALRRYLAIDLMSARLERLYILSENVANKEVGKAACTDTEEPFLDVLLA